MSRSVPQALKVLTSARIKRRRRQLGLTQRQASRRVNLHEMMFAHWEAGRKYPDSMSLLKIARALECTLDYLVGNSTFPKKGAINMTPFVEPEPEPVEQVKPVEQVVIVDRSPFQEIQQ